jgi:hypothetical protein
MDDAMHPLTSPLEALPIRNEPSCKPADLSDAQNGVLEHRAAVNEGLLVGYTSSPPPLIEDSSGRLDEEETSSQVEMQSLRSESDLLCNEVKAERRADDLRLSAYEYAALEKRFRTLSDQHNELHKLASAYDDIIWGSFYNHENLASIEQLRVEAGQEGSRVYVERNPRKPDSTDHHTLGKRLRPTAFGLKYWRLGAFWPLLIACMPCNRLPT